MTWGDISVARPSVSTLWVWTCQLLLRLWLSSYTMMIYFVTQPEVCYTLQPKWKDHPRYWGRQSVSPELFHYKWLSEWVIFMCARTRSCPLRENVTFVTFYFTENSFKRIFFHGIHLGQKYAYNGDDCLAIIIVYGWDSNKEYPHSLLLIQVIFSNDYIDLIREPVWPLNVTMPVVW